MRHRRSERHLGRETSHRVAMLKNMTISLFEHESITTTLPKAKELRRVAEPMITYAKTDGVSRRRLAFSRLGNKEAVGKLFTNLGPRFKNQQEDTCVSLSAVFVLGTMLPWLSSSFLIVQCHHVV